MNAQRTPSQTGIACTDPTRLLRQVMNNLTRCKHMLLANEPMYTFALQDLEAAKQSLIALAAIEAPHAVGTTPNN